MTTTLVRHDDFVEEISKEIIALAPDIDNPGLVLFREKAMTRLYQLLKVLAVYRRVHYKAEIELSNYDTVTMVERFLVKHHWSPEPKETTAEKLLNYLHYYEGLEENGTQTQGD